VLPEADEAVQRTGAEGEGVGDLADAGEWLVVGFKDSLTFNKGGFGGGEELQCAADVFETPQTMEGQVFDVDLRP
jgi:hypothetical protein